MSPRFVIVEDNVCKFLDQNNIDYIEVGVVAAAFNAASRGPIGVVVEPSKLELVLTVNDRISPSLAKLAAQLGGADLAIQFLKLCGAAIKVSALRFVA